MSNNEMSLGSETTMFWCRSTQDLIGSEQLKKFVRIYNVHTNQTTASKKDAALDDVLADRNLRNRMRDFFRNQLVWKLHGANQAQIISQISSMVDAAIKVLDLRNQQMKSGKLEKGSAEEIRMLNETLRWTDGGR